MSGIFDLGKLLTATLDISGTNHIDTEFVRSIYDRKYYSQQTASFEDVLYAASCLDLLDVNGTRIQLSDTGREFVRLMSVRDSKIMLDRNAAQEQFIRGCLDTERVIDVCSAIFGKFRVDYAELPPVHGIHVPTYLITGRCTCWKFLRMQALYAASGDW